MTGERAPQKLHRQKNAPTFCFFLHKPVVWVAADGGDHYEFLLIKNTRFPGGLFSFTLFVFTLFSVCVRLKRCLECIGGVQSFVLIMKSKLQF